jgi:hypothetical protein
VEWENLQELVKKMLGIIKEQELRIAGLEGQVLELKATIARLQKDSRNSSPSLVRYCKTKIGGKRKKRR